MGFPGRNTGVGCHFLLQGIFLIQGSNPCLLHWQVGSLPLAHQENLYPLLHWSDVVKWKSLSCVQIFATTWNIHRILQARILEWVAVPFSRGSSQPRDWTQVSHIAGGFFTSWATREAQLLHWRKSKFYWKYVSRETQGTVCFKRHQTGIRARRQEKPRASEVPSALECTK